MSFNPTIVPVPVTCRDIRTNRVLVTACLETLRSMATSSPYLWTYRYIQSADHIVRLLGHLMTEQIATVEWPADMSDPFIVLDECMMETLIMVVEVYLHEASEFMSAVDSGEISADPSDEWFQYSENLDTDSALQAMRDTIDALTEFKRYLKEMEF